MKKAIKILAYSIGTFLTILLIGLFCTCGWLSNKWSDFYTELEMKEIANQVNNAPELSENFYTAFDRIYPVHRNMTVRKMSVGVIWGLLSKNEDILNSKQCNCIRSSYSFKSKVPIIYHSWSHYITAHGIENFTTPDKCLDFIYASRKLEENSTKYFNKSFSELSVNENLELIIRLERPSLYETRPELLAEKMSKFK